MGGVDCETCSQLYLRTENLSITSSEVEDKNQEERKERTQIQSRQYVHKVALQTVDDMLARQKIMTFLFCGSLELFVITVDFFSLFFLRPYLRVWSTTMIMITSDKTCICLKLCFLLLPLYYWLCEKVWSSCLQVKIMHFLTIKERVVCTESLSSFQLYFLFFSNLHD